MDISAASWWWIAAGAMVAAELATGTFYLLMMALGMAGAAIAAHLGLGLPTQLIVAALAGGGATALWHWRRARAPQSAPVHQNRDVNLDIGERVDVAAWADGRTTRVNYRGTIWTARLQEGAPQTTGEHRVVAVEGNWLVIAPLVTY